MKLGKYIPTSPSSLKASLQSLLSHYCRSNIEIRQTTLPSGMAINFLDISGTKKQAVSSSSKPRTLVLMHGYGSGVGFFYENYDALASQFDRVLAVDWPGMGGSSRSLSLPPSSGSSSFSRYLSRCVDPEVSPRRSAVLSLIGGCLPQSIQRLLPPSIVHPYSANKSKGIDYSNSNNSNQDGLSEEKIVSNPQTTLSHPSQSVGFFIDNLEAWRKQELGDSSSFVLVGHSLGGYLSTHYALKYPEAVESLVLISPVGLAQHPPKEHHVPFGDLSWGHRAISLLLAANVTPQAIVRLLGPKGPSVVSSVLDRRFGKRWTTEERDLLASYLYHITAADPLGEYSLNSILQPIVYSSSSSSQGVVGKDGGEKRVRVGVFAREPVHDLVSNWKKSLLVIYGDHDWLRYPEAEQDVALWKKQGVDAALEIIENAGHHIYMDNPVDFHNSMFSWMKQRKVL